MTSGYVARVVDAMEWDDIRKIVPEEAASFERQLQGAGLGIDDFCLAVALDDWGAVEWSRDDEDAIEQAVAEIETTWRRLAGAFSVATTVKKAGLLLEPGYHNPDERDGLDKVTGGFFGVRGTWQLTPAGKLYAGQIERRFVVSTTRITKNPKQQRQGHGKAKD